MKKQILVLVAAFVCTASAFSKTNPGSISDLKHHYSGISFTENKGQVHDQDNKPRPDVLYSAMAGNMALHIRNTGVSYQLYRTDSSKEVEDRKTKHKRQEITQQTIYRIDLSWLNCNTSFARTEDMALAGYTNYYLGNCPDGALNVRSYSGVTLHDLYTGINLHYYEKNGALKHDYIVAPNTDYKQIQLKVEGADINVSKDGSLLLTTPLGKVEEGAPVVFQNGKQLKAKWQIKNTILSFEVEDYDPAYELIIDPITRLWGTFYGGGQGNDDQAYTCATDASGNVYFGGYTSCTTGAIIATTGSHQSSHGGAYHDSYLAKFNGNGVRQWATYYGGPGGEIATYCATDAGGNVYLTGQTTTTLGTIIATVGSHQPAFGGGTYDSFLVKFNSSGVRQWGTYYGGTGDEWPFSCATDVNGNVFLAGYTASATGTAIATPGSHQPAHAGGGYDAFLVKFSATGVRQWGTYYGGAALEDGNSCITDASGNVYLSGSTTSTAGISTAGCHQPALGGNNDAFIVKFDANGTRQWATYYGGAGQDGSLCSATDASGNVYLSGSSNSNTGTVIATAGSHQSSLGAGPGTVDAFLVKFDANGNRQWGTYYGDAGTDYGSSCATDIAGNVYMAGQTNSNAGTVIATANGHQPLYGGSTNFDAFLVKFNSSGVRQSATYYGGTGTDQGYACATAVTGHVYMAGISNTNPGSVIATPNSHQTAFAGGQNFDAFLVKFDACDAAPAQPAAINGPVTVCSGVTTSYTSAGVFGASSYTWALPSGWVAGGSSLNLSGIAGASGVFTLTAGNACGVSPIQTLSVTVNISPTVTINSGSICAGQAFTLVGGGADTYTYSSGSVVSPGTTTSYSVTGTSTAGCVSTNTAVGLVTVQPLPVISVNSGAICTGNSFTIVPAGASTYTIQGGAFVVNPASTTSYTVAGTSAEGCVSSNAAISNLVVNPLPAINASTSNTALCAGEEAILTGSGGATYTFNPGGNGVTITITPTLTTTYTVTGTDVNGCVNTALFTQNVDACTGIKENSSIAAGIKLYPNPARTMISLEVAQGTEITILDAIGQVVYSAQSTSGIHQVSLEHLAKGIYIVRLDDGVRYRSVKLIKE